MARADRLSGGFILLDPADHQPRRDSLGALEQMNRIQTSRLLVIDDNNLAGIITLRDLLRFLSLKLELEGESPRAAGIGPALTQGGDEDDDIARDAA